MTFSKRKSHQTSLIGRLGPKFVSLIYNQTWSMGHDKQHRAHDKKSKCIVLKPYNFLDATQTYALDLFIFFDSDFFCLSLTVKRDTATGAFAKDLLTT